MDRALQRYMHVIQRVGLKVKWSKVVWPSASGVEVLGLELDGTRKTVGLSPAKLAALMSDTERMLRDGRATGVQLQQLVGKWTWAALARRPALACLNAVYRFMQVAGPRLFNLWPTVRLELRVLVGIAPLLWSSLESTWFPDVIATDASSQGLGVVAIQAPRDQVIHAAADPVLLPAAGEEPRLPPALAPVLAAPQRVIVSSRWRDPEHINVLELRAVQTALRWVLSRPAGNNCRLLLLIDSSVSVFALNKGRSSARPVLRRLRAIAALVLAAGLRPFSRWIPTALNPADGPSRHVVR